MPQTKEELHQQYLDYIKELHRLVGLKRGEQLQFDFEGPTEVEPSEIEPLVETP